ncbi:ribonuclease H-like domain-containing protein [Lenzites betulinus]|nr:ribonuclease H-like domain-containing protein [Lenzites betulinus]
MASPQRIVWIDLETTGLNADTDIILEIAVVITDDLGRNEVDAQGLQLVIHADKVVLDGMVPACIQMHRESGLTDACIASSNTKEGVVNQVMAYIRRWVPYKHTAYLGGSSIHFDRAFLARHMPEIVSYLKYQQLDVTSIMIATKALYQGQRQPPRAVNTKHRHVVHAMNDIRDTIACLKYYLTTFFRPPGDVMNAGNSLIRSETMPTLQASGSSVGQSGTAERHEPGGVVRRVNSGAHNTKPYDAPPTKKGED